MFTEDRKYNYLAYLLSDNNNISNRVENIIMMTLWKEMIMGLVV